MSYYAVRKTDTPAIKNAPLEGLYEGSGYFSNAQLAALVIVLLIPMHHLVQSRWWDGTAVGMSTQPSNTARRQKPTYPASTAASSA